MRPEAEDWDVYMDTEPPVDNEPTPAPSAATGSDKAVLRTPLANLLLSERTLQVLEQQGVRTLGQLIRLHPTQLKSLPGFGPKAQQEVAEALDYFGLQLSADPPPKRVSRATQGKDTRPTRIRPVVRQLLLPEMETLPRVCAGCHQVLLPPDSRERYCSRACRPAKTVPSLLNPSVPPAPGSQLALSV